ncbi:MAG: hypothetical protein AAF206_29290, partial [Bacteroidota bacterium]
MPGYTFKAKSASLDLQTNELLELDRGRTQAYPNPTALPWRGVVMEKVSTELPARFDVSGGDKPVKLDKGILFLDDKQVAYGRFSKENILSLSEGRMGTWPYSIDTLSLSIRDGVSEGASISGSIRVPIFDDAFPYSGGISEDPSQQIVLNADVPERTLGMSMWKGNFAALTGSTVEAKLIDLNGDRRFFPKGNFDGSLSISMTDLEFVNGLEDADGTLVKRLKTALGVNSLALNLSEVVVNDFSSDPYAAPEDRYQVGDFQIGNAALQIGQKSMELGQVLLQHQTKTDTTPERLGLELSVFNGELNVRMIIWAKESGGVFSFDSIEITTKKLECDCTSLILPPSEREWDIMLDGIIGRHYARMLRDHQMKSDAMGPSPAWKPSLTYEDLKVQLRENSLGGLVRIDEETLVIPFLADKDGSGNVTKDQKLKIEAASGGFKGVSHIPNLKNLTFAALENVPEDKLPIDVTDQLDKLGIKVSNLPQHSKLLITGLRTPGTSLPATGATMELTLLYEVYNQGSDKRYLRFVQEKINIGPNSVDLKDKTFPLAAKGYGRQDRTLVYHPSVRFDGASTDSLSYAILNCEEGFVNFNIIGAYQAFFAPDTKPAQTKLIYRLPGPVVAAGAQYVTERGADTTRFFFHFNTDEQNAFRKSRKLSGHSLRYFIGEVLRGITRDAKTFKEGWNFAAHNAEQLIFRPGPESGYEAYIDNSNVDSYLQDGRYKGEYRTPGYFERNEAKSFEGIAFKKIAVELDGFKDEKSESLILPIENLMYDFATGLQIEYEKENVVPASRGALLGGWKYVISKLQFTFEDNALQPV